MSGVVPWGHSWVVVAANWQNAKKLEVTEDFVGRVIGVGATLTAGEEVEKVDPVSMFGMKVFRGGTVFVGCKVLASSSFCALDAAVDWDTSNCHLPLLDGQVATFVQEFGDGNEIDPAVVDPSGDVAADFAGGFWCRWRAAIFGRDANGKD